MKDFGVSVRISEFFGAVVALLDRLAVFDEFHRVADLALRTGDTEGNGSRGEADALWGAAMLANGEGPRMVAHLLEDFGFDLADALAGDAEFLADFLQRVADAVLESEAHLDDLALAGSQKLEHRVDVLFAQLPVGRLERVDRLFVLDEVTELAVFFGAHRRLERNDVLTDLLDVRDLLDVHLHFDGEFFERRLAAEFLDEAALRVRQFVDRFDNVDGDADGAGLVGDGAGDRLADPPGCIGAEFEAALGIELLDRAEETDVPLLDKI